MKLLALMVFTISIGLCYSESPEYHSSQDCWPMDRPLPAEFTYTDGRKRTVFSSSIPLMNYCAPYICAPSKWKKVDVKLEVIENGERKNITERMDLVELCEFDAVAFHIREEKARQELLRNVEEKFDEFKNYREREARKQT